MTSLYSTTVSPVKDSSSSPLSRLSNISKPPLRALYDLLIAPMEGVCMRVCVCFSGLCVCTSLDINSTFPSCLACRA